MSASIDGACAYIPVVTQALHADAMVSAQQIGCEGTDHEVSGLMANGVKVRHAPLPTTTTAVDKSTLIAGNDVITVTGLLVGAAIDVRDSGMSVSAGALATADANLVPLSAPLTGGPVDSTQELCGNISTPSDPVTPGATLSAPLIVGPICHGAHFALVRGTIVNATVVVFANGSAVGFGGAAPGDVIIELGGGRTLSVGETITAVQYLGDLGANLSPFSPPEPVVQSLPWPAIEIRGGHSFFAPKAGEQAIDGPVFPRGSAGGVDIRVQTCCGKTCRLTIFDSRGSRVAEPVLTQRYPGYYSFTWHWEASDGRPVPAAVPVGQYTVVAKSDCHDQAGKATFYVIFEPAEVVGPPRFSFDPTAVWFAVGANSTFGLQYYLHPSDARVFGPAIHAVNGLTSAFPAATALARLEEGLFTYSVTTSENDVVALITGTTLAQCADDACCLVAFLRSVGIPAHPVTADAAVETGGINWGFDTWVEFLASDAGVTDWRIFHPHEYPGMAAESRSTFGATRSVASKGANDFIIMAGASWPMAALDDGNNDVTFTRNECLEPVQGLGKAPWIDELCEAGYWSSPHWDCVGVHTNGLHPGAGFVFEDESLHFGGVVAGTVEVRNGEPELRSGTLRVQLAGGRPESKSVTEVVYDEYTVLASLPEGEAMTVPFRFELPRTVPPGQELLVRVLLEEWTAVLRRLEVRTGFEAELDWPRELPVDAGALARLTVRNVTRDTLRDVTVDLDMPFALEADDQTRQSLGDLGQGEEREVTCNVRAVASLDSGSVHAAVATSNNGSLLIRRSFRIPGSAEPVSDATPAYLPT